MPRRAGRWFTAALRRTAPPPTSPSSPTLRPFGIMVAMRSFAALLILAAAGCAPAATGSGDPEADGRALFDGRTLANWKSVEFGGEGKIEVVDGAPSKGPGAAPVTIVKFEDFQCPFCKQAQATEAQLLSRYGNKVKLVHRDFPISSIHPLAWKAHEAARCANEQGKFWPYHDLLYTNAPKLSVDDLKAYAKEAGLTMPAFEQCLTSEKYKTLVQKDVDEGTRLGVSGTPTFFINGRVLSGAQPLATFAGIVDEELTESR